jgi:uncharacterized membrane protein
MHFSRPEQKRVDMMAGVFRGLLWIKWFSEIYMHDFLYRNHHMRYLTTYGS